MTALKMMGLRRRGSAGGEAFEEPSSHGLQLGPTRDFWPWPLRNPPSSSLPRDKEDSGVSLTLSPGLWHRLCTGGSWKSLQCCCWAHLKTTCVLMLYPEKLHSYGCHMSKSNNFFFPFCVFLKKLAVLPRKKKRQLPRRVFNFNLLSHGRFFFFFFHANVVQSSR